MTQPNKFSGFLSNNFHLEGLNSMYAGHLLAVFLSLFGFSKNKNVYRNYKDILQSNHLINNLIKSES